MRDLEAAIEVVGAAGGPEELAGNIRSALKRGLPEFQPALCPHDGTIVLAGSGPSLPRYLDLLRSERAKDRPIVAVKGAHDFLVENGIEPDLYVNLDPRDRRNTVQRKNKRTVYLIASRCPPEMFDHLADCSLMVWHTYRPNSPEMDELKGKSAILGGTTSGMRAINLAYLMGFRRMRLYGYDSCLAPDGETKRLTGEKAGRIIDVHCGGKKFLANYAMAMQARDFRDYLRMCPDIQFEVVGDGLIAQIHREFQALKAA